MAYDISNKRHFFIYAGSSLTKVLLIKCNAIKFAIDTSISTKASLRIVLNGTIANQDLNIVKQNKNKIHIAMLKHNLNLENGNFLPSFLRAFARLNRNNIPTVPVDITHKLEYIASDTTPNLLSIVSNIIFIIDDRAVGIALLITFGKKLPFTLSLLGSNASKNEGTPIVTILIKVSCIGIKGYVSPINKNNTASMLEYMVLVKNREAERSMLFIVLRPSATTLGIDAKFESSRTNCETFLLASLPLAIAILQSASFNARTSLTPSPVIATVLPASFSAKTRAFF